MTTLSATSSTSKRKRTASSPTRSKGRFAGNPTPVLMLKFDPLAVQSAACAECAHDVFRVLSVDGQKELGTTTRAVLAALSDQNALWFRTGLIDRVCQPVTFNGQPCIFVRAEASEAAVRA